MFHAKAPRQTQDAKRTSNVRNASGESGKLSPLKRFPFLVLMADTLLKQGANEIRTHHKQSLDRPARSFTLTCHIDVGYRG
jgi:hypothetical protein